MSLFRSKPDPAQINARPGTLMRAIGIEVTEIGDDYVRGRMPVDERTRQPFGLLHGGASVALAETLGSYAGGLCVDDDEMVVGQEIASHHLRPKTDGHVIGTARPLHVGRRSHIWDITIEDEAGKRVCVSRLTLAVIARPR